MSEFDDLLEEDGLPAVLEVMGDTVTYTTRADVETAPTGAVGPEELIEENYANGVRMLRSRKVTLGRDPANGGVADPKVHDTITIDGEIWNIQAIVSQTAVVSILEVTRNATAERAHQGFRR